MYTSLLVFFTPSASTKWWLYPFPINAVILLGYQRMLQRENLIDSYNDSRNMTYSYKPCTDPLIGKLVMLHITGIELLSFFLPKGLLKTRIKVIRLVNNYG
jgi:hypothetical protein